MKKCPVCFKDHIKVALECSIKCMLMNRHVKIGNCWEWTGKISKMGYGCLVFGENGKKNHLLAHRESYKIFKGQIPTKLFVCHTCDNRKCINPDHLWTGTCKENIQDAKLKGRLAKQIGRKHKPETLIKLKFRKRPDKKGEKHHLAKLSESQVLEIRELLKTNIKRKEIYIKYGISRQYLYSIKSKLAWKHI